MLGQEVDNLWKYYNELSTQFPILDVTQFFLRADIREFDDHYEVTCDMPGVDTSSIKIDAERGTLKIRAQRTVVNNTSTTHGTTDTKYVTKERFMGEYSRSFSLPDDAQVKSSKASYENGVLSIAIPRSVKEDAYSIPITTV